LSNSARFSPRAGFRLRGENTAAGMDTANRRKPETRKGEKNEYHINRKQAHD